ncbi:MAG: hypothetical protein M1836_006339 [Candelina mexicana]|nr:MAG: hypothetical protein M1836_006339 [Candelina mexicana]
MPLLLNETQSLAHVGASMVHGGFIVLHSRTEGHGAEKAAFLGLVVLLLAYFAFHVDAVAAGAGLGVRGEEEKGEEKGEKVEGGEHGDNSDDADDDADYGGVVRDGDDGGGDKDRLKVQVDGNGV